MTKEALAQRLNGRAYMSELTDDEEREAKAAGLVILFGGSDDNMEFRGAINNEVSCYGGGTAYLTNAGLLRNECDCDDCPYHEKLKAKATTIEAVWSEHGYSWTYETSIPHVTFDIVDGDDMYCRGIVFELAAVGALKA